MFVPAHFKSISPHLMRSYCTPRPHSFDSTAELRIKKLGYDKLRSWVDELNEAAVPLGSALNTSKVRPIQINHHPVKRLNMILRQATARGDLSTIEAILTEIRFDSFKHHVQANVLHISAKEGSSKIAKLLIEYGADVNERYGNIKSEWIYRDYVEEDYAENKGPSPLLFAVMHQKLEVVQILIENHANINQSADLLLQDHPDFKFYSNVVPLHYAAVNGHYELVDMLVKNDANPNAQNGFGESPLLMAVWKGHLKVVKMLLQHGADPRQENNWGLPMRAFTTNDEVRNLLNRS